MAAFYSLILVLLLSIAGYFGGSAAGTFFGIIIPYAAIAVFLVGLVYRILLWANTPVPFRITATCGQQKSLPWIQSNRLDNPASGTATVIRMALEVLLFRSLFRNTKAEIKDGPRLVFSERKFLWLAALAFHWTFLFILFRHLRFFLEPVPGCVLIAQELDGFFQIGTPILYMTDLIILAALAFLLIRRLADVQIRYISLFADYFALFLLLGLALSGVVLRYFIKTDISGIKELAMGLVTFSPAVPAGIHPIFFIHIFLLSILVAYFPFSKLMHMGGVFLSPTRNLANNNRTKRHINPWNHPVKVHTYEEWEEEFRDKIKAAGLPLEKV
ncbi:MAG: sulfate reduction electron transfer complex DsrMKJOP subunit DsrM [Acidobacteria bacterium]|nr:sulfate reduction electron transfer complex DsrMKJOP subunit DsrM [Acidobacteriota bacterium]